MNLCRLIAIVCVCLIESFYADCFLHPENKNEIGMNNGTCLNQKCIKEGKKRICLLHNQE